MQLDYLINFVAQVRDFKEGVLSIDVCMGTLAKACARHGVALVSPELKLKSGVSVDERMPGVRAIPDEESLWERWVETNYFAFLSETNLVFQTSRFIEEYDVIVGGEYVLRPTARAYGQLYAEWANSVSWLKKSDWTYIDFYGGGLTDDYWDWAEAALQVVKALSK